MPRASHYAHAGAGDLVRLAERHALADQPLGDVGGEREALRAPSAASRSVSNAQRRDHAGAARAARSSSVSTASNTGSLSSCRSRL